MTVEQIDPDAILESIFEVRFAPLDWPEISLGRLIGAISSSGLGIERLPETDIPMSARDADPKLWHQTLYQAEDKGYILRWGYEVFAVHRVAPYPGWDQYCRYVLESIERFIDKDSLSRATEARLRYINALTRSTHGVKTIEDMNLEVNIGERRISDLTISFSSKDDAEIESFVRIASARHVSGNIPSDTSFAVDITVQSSELENWSTSCLSEWLATARNEKNRIFFSLLPDRIIERLEVKS